MQGLPLDDAKALANGRSIECPSCGDAFPPELTPIVAGGSIVLCCSKCNHAFVPSVLGEQKAVTGRSGQESVLDELLARVENAVPPPVAEEAIGDVYKYRSANARSLRILLDRKVYCGPPRDLNDPLDCQFDMKAEINRALVRIAASLGDDDLEPRRRLRTIRAAFMEPTSGTERGTPLTFIDNHEQQMSASGVLCFSEAPDIDALWAHYADNHAGFCLGFDPIRLVREPPDDANKSDFGEGAAVMTRVVYGAEHPFDDAISEFVWAKAAHRGIEPESLQLVLAVCRTTVEALFVKTRAWSYEKEVRLVWTSRCGPFTFRNTTLRSVVFGFRMEQETRARLQEILHRPEWSHVLGLSGPPADGESPRADRGCAGDRRRRVCRTGRRDHDAQHPLALRAPAAPHRGRRHGV